MTAAVTAETRARWDRWHTIAVTQARRARARDHRQAAAPLAAGIAVTAAAVRAATALPMITVIITGSLIIAAAVMAAVACWLVDRGHDRRPLFQAATATPCAGQCSCRAPLAGRPAPAAETAALAVMDAAKPARPAAPPMPPHSPDWPMHQPSEVPFTVQVGPSAALERAARLLPPGFDPKVDSLVGGIKPVTDVGQQIRDGAL